MEFLGSVAMEAGAVVEVGGVGMGEAEGFALVRVVVPRSSLLVPLRSLSSRASIKERVK